MELLVGQQVIQRVERCPEEVRLLGEDLGPLRQ